MKFNKIIKKTIVVGIISTVALMGFTGCKKSGEKEIDLKAVVESLLSEIKYEDQLSEVDYDIIYDMEDIKVTESAVYVSSGATAEEIATFKCETEEDAKKAQAVLEERVEEQKASFQDYVPKELEKLDKAVIIKRGKSLVLSISNDAAKAKKLIDKSSN